MSTTLHEYPDHHVEVEQESYAHLASHMTAVAFPVITRTVGELATFPWGDLERPFAVLERVR